MSVINRTVKTRVETHLDFMEIEKLDALCALHRRSRSAMLAILVGQQNVIADAPPEPVR